ncbi:30S ribosome-binding factor RbfA [Prosthecomicrobium hirschii]|uniref:30S ribosome-binding factor RbfA n=1 Tax=Prosthecodimorpha hirschii TaxID=665126 RepID=UPI0011263D20|nr:30S ribosome-binding factor RbfA [Prosthecomicrobium hirschii]MCW1841548.1 30S ribosome-binding factor RbfA [Prosthecomicrobium hirschii]TPQ50486.1 30S ribosome-binding factor RbfA [Prosthecomicrobium hirschii]
MPPHNPTPAGPSQRQLRVGEIVRHALSDILSRGAIADPDLDGVIITVPEVRMSPDLKQATVLVMPLGGRDADRVLAGLERSRKWLRGQIARRVDLRFAPEIRFRLDTRYDDDDQINALLRTPEVRQDIEGGDRED